VTISENLALKYGNFVVLQTFFSTKILLYELHWISFVVAMWQKISPLPQKQK
jgi:hypothetical protein